MNKIVNKNKMYSNVKSKLVNWFPPFLFLIAFVLIWHLSIVLFSIPNYLIPPPGKIAQHIAANFSTLLKDTSITMFESVAGFLVGGIFGIVVAIGFAHSKSLEKAVYPYMIALKAIPIVAIAPLLVLWFGNGIFGKIIMSATIGFFPVIVNTTTGLKSVDQESLDLFKSLSASKLDIFLKLRFPTSLPHIFSALKISSTLSVVGAIVAEFSGAKAGLGYSMLVAVYQLDTESLYAGILASALGGILFFGLIALIEKKVLKWHVITMDAK